MHICSTYECSYEAYIICHINLYTLSYGPHILRQRIWELYVAKLPMFARSINMLLTIKCWHCFKNTDKQDANKNLLLSKSKDKLKKHENLLR